MRKKTSAKNTELEKLIGDFDGRWGRVGLRFRKSSVSFSKCGGRFQFCETDGVIDF